MTEPALSRWTAAHVLRIETGACCAPVITGADVCPVLPGQDVWDMWPLAHADGRTAPVEGGRLWFALAAPCLPDPVDRHALARIRLLHERDGAFRDCGDALPDGCSPGSREWSGSAVLQDDGAVMLFFTAAGQRGDTVPTFEQRLFQISGRLGSQHGLPGIIWDGPPEESVQSDNNIYVRANQATGLPGQIKAFRDPAYFRDPADGRAYLVFAASLKNSTHQANGLVGLACAKDGMRSWRLLPPLLSADGVNNELERPHVVLSGGLYYLFWSTQRHTFAADGPSGPNGLYGMVADRFAGPYAPLNGSGLVLANPPAEPTQAYSWWVMDGGLVTSFVDYWGMAGRGMAGRGMAGRGMADHPELVRSQFGGTPAPMLRLHLQGDRAWLIPR